MKKLIRITTVAYSLGGLLKGQLNYMSNHFDVIGISSSEDGYLKRVISKKENIRVIPVEMTRKITLFRDFSAFWKLFWIFKKEKPFIVHTHTPKAGTVGMFAAYMAGVPHRLHTIAGMPLMEATGSKRRLLDFVEKITYKCATKIYPNSYGLEEFILEQKFTIPEKLKVIGKGSSNGIDTSIFDPAGVKESEIKEIKERYSLQDEHFIFIFIGRLVKDKGVNELVAAFETLCKKYKHIKLLLVGRSEIELDPLEEKTNAIISSNEHIITTGTQDDVRPYLKLSDLLTFPSYREGFPNVVMEAGAMGLPAIVSDINGCNEIIVEGKNGVIIPPKSEDALRDKMEELLLAPEQLAVLTGNTRQMIQERFERNFIWEELLKEYQSLGG